jgi:hypothetical protein
MDVQPGLVTAEILVTGQFWSPGSSGHRAVLVTGQFWSPGSSDHRAARPGQRCP